MKTIIVIISKNKSKIKKFSLTKYAWNSILHNAVQISSGSVNKYVTVSDAVTSLYKIS